MLTAASVRLRRRDGRARSSRSQADWPIAVTYVAAAVAGAACRRSARACGPAGPTCSTQPARCRPPSRSRRWSTRRCSSSARSWSTVLATNIQPGPRAGHRDRRPACSAASAFAAQRGTEPPAAPARPHGRGPAADAVAHRRAAGGRLPRPRHPVRGRRGDHRRLRRRAGPQGLRRRRCSRSGRWAACSPGSSPARSRGGRDPDVRVRWGALGMAVRDGAALLRRLASR